MEESDEEQKLVEDAPKLGGSGSGGSSNIGDVTDAAPISESELTSSLGLQEEKHSEKSGSTPEPAPPPQGTGTTLIGCLAAILGTICGVTSFSCVQIMGDFIPGFELNLWRFVVQFLCMALIVLVTDLDVRVPRGSIGYLCLASILCVTSAFPFCETAKHISAGAVGCINPTFVLLILSLASAVMHRRCRLYVVVGIVVCIVGSVLYVQPEFMFGKDNSDQLMHPITCEKHHDTPDTEEEAKTRHTRPTHRPALTVTNATTTTAMALENGTWFEPGLGSDSEPVLNLTDRGWSFNDVTHSTGNSLETNLLIGYMWLSVSCISFAALLLLVKTKLQSINCFALCFWLGLFTILVSVALVIFVESPSFPWSMKCLITLITFAVVGGSAQIFQFWAVNLLPLPLFAVFFSLATIFYSAVQYTLLKNISPSKFNALELAGASLVFLGNIIRSLYALYEERSAAKGDNRNKDDYEQTFEMNEAVSED